MDTKNPDLRGKIAVYTRVSTDEQVRDEGSLDNQVHRCRQYLTSLDYRSEVLASVKEYREEAKSGKDLDRPVVQRLLRDIRAGRVKLVVVTELSRISRSVSDFLALSAELKDLNVEFISLKERFDTTTPHGRLILVVLMALNEFERETTALRTKLAHRDRAERGLFSGGAIPIGYTPDPTRSGHFMVVEDEAPVVRAAFATYLETGSLASTVRRLDEAGYRRKDRVTDEGASPGKAMSWAALAHVLQNPVYVGKKEVNRAARFLPPEEAARLPAAEQYRLVDAVWPALVDDVSFERAGKLLAENYARNGNIIAEKHHDYVLTGLIHCGTCGTALEGASQRPNPGADARYFYYRHHAGTKQPGCRISIRAEMVEAAVVDRLKKLARNGPLLDAIVEAANRRLATTAPEVERDLKAARHRAVQLDAQHANLTAHLLAAPAGVPLDSFWTTAKELAATAAGARGEVARLERALGDLACARMNADDYRRALRQFAAVWGKLDAYEQTEVLGLLVARVEITPDEMRVTLLDDVPEQGPAGALTGGGGAYAAPKEWLPTPRSDLTGVEETLNLHELWPKVEGPKTKKLRERAERRERLTRNPPAAEALNKALAWQGDIENGGLRRSDIARREGLTRARVTQIMSLLKLPEDVKGRLLNGDSRLSTMTIRQGMSLVEVNSR